MFRGKVVPAPRVDTKEPIPEDYIWKLADFVPREYERVTVVGSHIEGYFAERVAGSQSAGDLSMGHAIAVLGRKCGPLVVEVEVGRTSFLLPILILRFVND